MPSLQHFPAEATRVTKAPRVCVCLFPGKPGGSHLLLQPLQGIQIHGHLAPVPLRLWGSQRGHSPAG